MLTSINFLLSPNNFIFPALFSMSNWYLAISADISKEDAIATGKEAISDKISGNIVKEIYVPGRIINFVVK